MSKKKKKKKRQATLDTSAAPFALARDTARQRTVPRECLIVLVDMAHVLAVLTRHRRSRHSNAHTVVACDMALQRALAIRCARGGQEVDGRSDVFPGCAEDAWLAHRNAHPPQSSAARRLLHDATWQADAVAAQRARRMDATMQQLDEQRYTCDVGRMKTKINIFFLKKKHEQKTRTNAKKKVKKIINK